MPLHAVEEVTEVSAAGFFVVGTLFFSSGAVSHVLLS
jgi:hypothetical protein